MSTVEVPALLKVYDSKVVPLLSRPHPPTLLLAQPTRREFLRCNEPLPAGVTCSPQRLRGRRVAVRRNRKLKMANPIVATWPDDQMVATRSPDIVCTVSGQADIRFGDYILQLPQGTFCLLPPELPREDGSRGHVRAGRDGMCDLLWLRVHSEMVETWVCHSHGQKHWIGNETRRVSIPDREAIIYCSTLLRELSAPGEEARAMCHGALKVLCGTIRRHLHEGAFVSVSTWPPVMVSGEPWKPMQYACDYVRENMAHPHTIESIARLVYVSTTQFKIQFKKECGQTFNQYLTQQRLEKAEAMLRDTNWPAHIVARNIGINPSHLRRLCQRHFHCPPSELRRRLRSAEKT